MSAAEVAEGAVATVVRAGERGGGTEQIRARPISDFYPVGDTRPVCFLKVDVEGFELHAIPSAGELLLGAHKVETLLVEFGPPSRWRSAAKDESEDGLKLVQDMATMHGMEPRLINSLVWQEFMGRASEEAKAHARAHNFVPLTSPSRQQLLVDTMSVCCEGCEYPSVLHRAEGLAD